MRIARAGRAGRRRHIAVGFLFILLSSCGPSGPPPSEDGSTAAEPSPSDLRVVSLLPAASSMLERMGMADRVVGRAVEDRSPALASVPLAGRVLQPDRETVVALEPDVVLVWAGLDPADLREALAGTGAEVVPLRLDRIDDVGPAWRAVGRAVGRANRAAELADDLRAELTPLGRDAPLPAPRVLWVVGDRPLVVAGAGTVLDDLLRTVGAANALGLEGPPWPRPGFEALAAMDPDLVLWSAPEAPPGPGLHPWSALPAVGHGRVRRLDPDTSLEAGPDLAALAHTIYRLVHGVPAPTAPHTS